jgi:hypothetical protein
VLRLDVPLPERPEIDGLPALENDVLRDPDSFGSGVVPRDDIFASVGDSGWDLEKPAKSRLGISIEYMRQSSSAVVQKDSTHHPRSHPFQRCILRRAFWAP